MTNPTETRAAVETYFKAWTSGDVDGAFACLAPDLEFVGPSAHYSSADAFRPALIGFAKLTSSASIVELLVAGDRAAMLYDCRFHGAGAARIASFFRVEQKRIRWYETQFDPTEFKNAVAAAQKKA